jgi:hypothetical protein
MPVRTAINAVTCAASLSQEVKPPQQTIPILTTETVARAPESFGAILGIHQSADGKILVNDALRRQMKLFDTTFATSTVVFDSMPGEANSYGRGGVPLIPFTGDSSLFLDWNAQTLIVLDGHGAVARALALPSLRDVRAAIGAGTGVDAKGRIVFRAMRVLSSAASQVGGIDYSDSLTVVRADLEARRTDTIAHVARPLMKLTTEKYSDGSAARIFALDPLQPVDEWAVLSNGAVAIVRGHDYHVDWIQPDGSVVSTPKIPFDWKHLSDDDKQRLADSVRAAQNALLADGYPDAEMRVRAVPCDGGGRGEPRVGGDGGGRSGARGGNGGAPPPPTGMCTQMLTGGGAGRGSLPPIPPLTDLLRERQIDDYEPPLLPGGTIADRDGNLWILPRATKLSQHGELVYDVVNGKGELFERVRLPVGRAVAGFGKGGVVYLTSGDRTTGYTLERARIPMAGPSPKK